MPLLNTADKVYFGETAVTRIFLGDRQVWPYLAFHPPVISKVSSDGTLSLSWETYPFATEYQIRRNGVHIRTQANRLYVDSGLQWGGQYWYTISPVVNGVVDTESGKSATVTIPKGKMSVLSAPSRSYKRVTVSWAAVPGATNYYIYVDDDFHADQVTTSIAIATQENKTVKVFVVPYRNGLLGVESNTYIYYSGRKAKVDQGSKTNMIFIPNKLDSWRSNDGWGQLEGTAAQGTFGTYSSYRGLIYYGGYGVRAELQEELGDTVVGKLRQENGACTKAELFLYKKPGVGTNARVTVGVQRSESKFSDEDPPTGTQTIDIKSPAGGDGTWIDIGTGHGNALGNGGKRALLLRRDGTANYAQFTNCRLRLSWSWNYVTSPAEPNSWIVE